MVTGLCEIRGTEDHHSLVLSDLNKGKQAHWSKFVIGKRIFMEFTAMMSNNSGLW